MLLLIALTSFATIALGVLALAQRPLAPARVRARALGGGASAEMVATDRPFSQRMARPLAGALLRAMPHRWLRSLETTMVAAGEPLDIGFFVLLWVLAAAGGVFVGLLLAVWWSALVFGGLGVYLPLFWLRRLADNRRKAISRALPDAIDMLVTCVEAGLGLDAALVRVGEATDGPLAAEIERTMQEIAIGRSRQEALLDLGTRPGVRELDSLIRPVVQAERSGVSIGTALRVQADDLRVRRRQRAQETAQKIAPKMTMAIILFFVPAVMLVSVAPAMFSLIDFFSDGWSG